MKNRKSKIVNSKWLLALAAACAIHFAASAHPVTQGAIGIEVFPDRVQVFVRVSLEEVVVSCAMKTDADGKFSGFGEAFKKHGDYFLKHFGLAADGKLLSGKIVAISEPDEAKAPIGRLEVEKYFVTFEFEFALPKDAQSPKQISLTQEVLKEFEFAPGNPWEATYRVKIGVTDQMATDGLFLPRGEKLEYACKWDAPVLPQTSEKKAEPQVQVDRWGVFKHQLWEGVMHILTGYDHLLFISALVLASVSLWDLVKVVSAFTLAHTTTLALSVFKIFTLPTQIVEPMIAASIVFVALQNVFKPQQSRGWKRLVAAFFFGLFHGLGYAGGLVESMQGLPGTLIAGAVISFSVGVELGHQMLIIPLYSALALSQRSRADEKSREELSLHTVRYGSVIISVAGAFFLFMALKSAIFGE